MTTSGPVLNENWDHNYTCITSNDNNCYFAYFCCWKAACICFMPMQGFHIVLSTKIICFLSIYLLRNFDKFQIRAGHSMQM